jgi:hypothetical protein
MHIGTHVKWPLLLSDFDKNLSFLNRISINAQIPDLVKIRPAGAEDEQANLTELITVAFRNFSKAPKHYNEQLSKISSKEKSIIGKNTVLGSQTLTYSGRTLL